MEVDKKYKPQRIVSAKERISEYVVDESLIKVRSEFSWLWIVIESENKLILTLTISKERNMLIAVIHLWSCQNSLETSSFDRWWYLVPNGL